MIFIIGGHASGKLEYVINELNYNEEDIAIAELDEKPVLANLHDLVRNEKPLNELLDRLLNKEVITCDEVGCGVIPLDKKDRDYRETVGRICIELAKHADKVVRIYSGIPTVIKEKR